MTNLPDHVGFTGTRKGMTVNQLGMVKALLAQGKSPQALAESWFHHGMCIGSDTEAHKIAKGLTHKIYGHPPSDKKYYSDLALECDAIDPPYSYHGRNQRIVMAVRFLIATPYDNSGKGGTWWTINCARKMNKPRIIIHRDGSVIKEEGF